MNARGGGSRSAVVLAGGPVRPTPELRALVTGHALVVAADGGLAHAAPLGLRADLIVGDFDSVRPETLAAAGGVPRERHPRDKGELDLELALDAARRRGADAVLLVGALGGRLDQTLAALAIAVRLRRDGIAVRLHDGREDVRPLQAGDVVSLRLPRGRRFSLVACHEGGAVVDVEGARYPLRAASLPFGVGLGVSNEAEGGPRIRVREGRAVLIVEAEGERGSDGVRPGDRDGGLG